MHELSIALSIVEMVEEEVHSRGPVRVLAVHLKLGAFSGVVKDALLSSYEAAIEQTPLAGSKLVIDEIPVLMDCPQCHERKGVHSVQQLCCETCGTPARDVVQGRELLVSGLEILE